MLDSIMLLFNNRAETMEGVLREAKHATNGRLLDTQSGEIILIAQTIGSLHSGFCCLVMACTQRLDGIVEKTVSGKNM